MEMVYTNIIQYVMPSIFVVNLKVLVLRRSRFLCGFFLNADEMDG